ncbi:hypothetical protein IPN35_00820 [Candidatus Peregrinibacteria bacterium]|nr:MAG: hypothetical protein IPN35_00820 [Candidatus Peregrinibacteria bacterium]
MKKGEELLEIRRKILHLLIGVSVAALLWLNIVDGVFLLAISFLILTFFLLFREHKSSLPIFHRLVSLFERKKHLDNVPGTSAIWFFFGCAVTALFFSRSIAVASIIILAFGDTFSNLVGHHWGRIATIFHPKKKIEGPIAAIFLSTIVAGLFVDFRAAFLASTVAMILEFPNWTFFGRRIDDNLIIPFSAALTLLFCERVLGMTL